MMKKSKELIDMSNFTAFTTVIRKDNHPKGKHIQYQINPHKKHKNKRVVKLYFRDNVTKHLKLKKNDRVLMLHHNDDLNKILLMKHERGLKANFPSKCDSSYIYVCTTIECRELKITSGIQIAEAIFHPKNIVEFNIRET